MDNEEFKRYCHVFDTILATARKDLHDDDILTAHITQLQAALHDLLDTLDEP